MWRCLVLAFLAAASPAASAQVGTLRPVDEAAEDPSLLLFRLRMIEAVAARDTAFVYDHLWGAVQNSFGGEGGVAEFRAMWRPGDPDSDLWPTLATVLGGGGTYVRDGQAPFPDGGASTASFYAPYWAAAFPADLDAFGYGVIIGEGVRVRAAPSTDAGVLGALSYDVVRVLDFFPHLSGPEGAVPEGWVQVELADGRAGYVDERYVGSAVGWRAVFHEVDGRWVVTSLLAGD